MLSPPKHRPRASSTSTNIRPPTSSLGRRRSNTCLQQSFQESAVEPDVQPSPSMLQWFVSSFIQWLHVPQKHTLSWSTPSSPRSSTDDLILPLSASAHTVSFTITEPLEDIPAEAFRWRLLPSHLPILIVILMFPLSTALVLWCLSTLPISLSWPHDIADLAQLGRELHGYSQSGLWPLSHVIGVMAISAVWKHAWSIPGSVLWNVLGGTLFSPFYATILLTTLTTIGSLCATMLSTPLGPFLAKIFPRALDMTRNALGGDSDSDTSGNQSKPKSSAWVRLSVLRLIGVVPWSGINIACGVCGVSLVDCMLGTFIGCLPWTAVTCQIGDILQTVASTPSTSPQTVSSLLATPAIILKLVFLSVLSLAPILGRGKLRAMISHSPRIPTVTTDTNTSAEERKARWTWVQEWRTKIRLSSRSRAREQQAQDQLTLDTLIDEKRRMQDLSPS
ncbi:hypothetical protein CPC08DRAFT_626946 [Agrocybe pediades]|nr:hypothetical protein CPC08DRAFT_626946 [Agrocybe pediades]